MKIIVAVLGIVGIVILAILASGQITSDAMAVVVGVVVGIAASIPTSLFMMMLLNRQHDDPPVHTERPAQRSDVPSVMIVNQIPDGYGQYPERPALPAGSYRVIEARREGWQ